MKKLLLLLLLSLGLISSANDKEAVEINTKKLIALNNCLECNLFEANLRYKNLSGAKLNRANLSGADLERVDLSDANLTGANLSGADLRYADLSNANLSGTNLRFADLSYANLGKTYLRQADFSGTDLSDTSLRDADISGLIFCLTMTPWGLDNSGCNKLNEEEKKLFVEELYLREEESYAKEELLNANQLIADIAAKYGLAALRRAAEIQAFEKEQFNRLLAQEVQAEQDLARTLAIEDQLNKLKTAYLNNIAAKVRTYWRYQGADVDWTCDVYVRQDIDGNVESVMTMNCNLYNEKVDSFKNSIERAVYNASPLPAAPDDAVFDRQIIFRFRVN